MKKITEETVEHVAAIARIKLTPSELKRMQKDLTEILAAFKTLDEAPSAEPSFQPVPMENVMREDIIEEPLPRDIALKNTKHKEKGFFKGPKA
ncbi:MAG: Asp-tRNA(Asn)/Glu-tRNA(Gln) amidotransferase subunit GatC, partial [Candidatus Aenigmarchaeota archaeon]|nr:Asp-tRNA(Asn)/Glu-tRNA(Gln) amidotransferase subunit GatC [Candidatus Aenigmarchaeota archaeon]